MLIWGKEQEIYLYISFFCSQLTDSFYRSCPPRYRINIILLKRMNKKYSSAIFLINHIRVRFTSFSICTIIQQHLLAISLEGSIDIRNTYCGVSLAYILYNMIIKLLESRYMQCTSYYCMITQYSCLFFYYSYDDSYDINQNLTYTMNLKLQLSISKYSNNYNCTRTRIFVSRYLDTCDTMLLLLLLFYRLFHTYHL